MEGFSSSNIKTLVMDVLDDSSVQGTVERVIKEAGRVDIVVSNAGVPCYGEHTYYGPLNTHLCSKCRARAGYPN